MIAAVVTAARRAVLLALAMAAGAPAARADEKADALGRELVAALGGEGTWEKARQFRFDFVVEREGKAIARFSHAWDRYTGDYRLTGMDKTEAPFAVFFNVNTRRGEVFVNRKSVEGDPQAEQLTSAYERFINDTYWLLAPWKVFDPGVVRTYEGEKPCPDGGVCDVLKLTFGENVGLTPRDAYWLWITREGRRMVQWQYVLKGTAEEPTTAAWKEWQSFGGIALSLEKPISGRPVVIRFENVAVSAARDDSLFRPGSTP
ncbi:MAG: hypothetical protein ACRD3M_02370 [Thermoanaerobaculia bacterium]